MISNKIMKCNSFSEILSEIKLRPIITRLTLTYDKDNNLESFPQRNSSNKKLFAGMMKIYTNTTFNQNWNGDGWFAAISHNN